MDVDVKVETMDVDVILDAETTSYGLLSCFAAVAAVVWVLQAAADVAAATAVS